MGYVMSEEQYNALNKALMKSHLSDIFEVTQEDNVDYIINEEEDEVLSLSDGLAQIHDGLIDFVDCYDFDDNDIEAYDSLMRLFNIYDEDVSCRNI